MSTNLLARVLGLYLLRAEQKRQNCGVIASSADDARFIVGEHLHGGNLSWFAAKHCGKPEFGGAG